MLTGEKRSHSFRMDEDFDAPAPRWPVLSLVRIIWKRKVQIVAAWVALTAAVVTVVMTWPATYRAETLILVDQQKIPEKFVSTTISAELQDRLATISQQILSNTRLLKIIDTFKLYEKERKQMVQEEVLELMRSDIQVVPEKGWIQNRPGAFRVSYEGHDPNIVAQVTNQIGNLFIEENLRSRETIAEGTSDFMRSQMDEAKKNLEAQEKKLSAFKLAYNGELPQQETSLAQELSRLQVQLQGNQDAQNRASQNKITVESAVNVAQTTESSLKRLIEAGNALNARGGGAPGGPAEKKKSEQLEEQLASMKARYGEKYPDVIALTAEIERTKAQEKKDDAAKVAASNASKQDEEKEAAVESPDAVRLLAGERERIAALNAQLSVIDKELKTRQADHEKILKQIDAVQARLHRLPVREQEMAEVTRDYETSKANYNSLQDKIFAADMSTEMERRQKSERFTVLDSARVPELPISPNRPLFTGLGCFGGLLLASGVFLFAELRKNKFLGEWELPEGVVVLGRIPRLPLGSQNAGRRFTPWGRMAIPATTALLAVVSLVAYMVWIRR